MFSAADRVNGYGSVDELVMREERGTEKWIICCRTGFAVTVFPFSSWRRRLGGGGDNHNSEQFLSYFWLL